MSPIAIAVGFTLFALAISIVFALCPISVSVLHEESDPMSMLPTGTPLGTVTAAAERQLVRMLLRRALFDDERVALIARAERAGIEIEGVYRLQLGDTGAPGFNQWHFIPREGPRGLPAR